MQVGEDLLDHPFGPAIRVGGALLGAFLGERQAVRIAVDGRRAGEHDGLAAVVAHDVHEHQGVLDVVVVVLDGLGHRFAHGLKACEVDDAVDLVIGEDFLHGFAIKYICLVEGEILGFFVSDDLAHARYGDLACVGKVVYDDNLVVAVEQLDNGMGADKTGTAGYQHAGILWFEHLGHICLPSEMVAV